MYSLCALFQNDLDRTFKCFSVVLISNFDNYSLIKPFSLDIFFTYDSNLLQLSMIGNNLKYNSDS